MELVLRTLASGAPGVLPGADPSAANRLDAFVSSWDPLRDPVGWLLAERAGQLAGWARIDPIHRDLYSIIDVYVPPGPRRLVHGQTLLRALTARFAGRRVEAATWHQGSDPFVHALLTAPLPEGQFRVYVEKLYVRRALDDYRSPYADRFALRSLREVGDAAFIQVLAEALKGSLARDIPDVRPEVEFAEMRDMEGPTHDPSAWSLACWDGEAAGVILPNRFVGPGQEGTFTFLGLAPPWRGRGLGPALHARGLALLHAMGVRSYLCSTDVQNTPMLRLYARHGCAPFDIRRQYLWTPTAS